MKILGISAFYHDSAAALVEDGVVVAAAQEERFTRKKHDPAFPGTLSTIAWDSLVVHSTISITSRFTTSRC